MKRWLLCALAGVLSTACAHVDKSAALTEISFEKKQSLFWKPAFKIRREVLPNGLTVLYVEDRSVPIVSYSTWFKVGSSYEKTGATGIAHLFEHMMFKGTEKFPGKAFFNRLESRGAMINAYTERDATVYYAVLAPRDLELLIEMESDRMGNLKITQADLDSERQVVQEERRLRVDSDYGAQALEAFHEAAFPGHPYAWPIIGYQTDLERLSVVECGAFYHRYYQPKNAVVVIAGDFDLNETRGWIKKYYGGIAGVDVPPLVLPNERKVPKQNQLVYEKPVKAETIFVGYHIPSMFHADAEKLSMLAWSYFGMASSPAQVKLVREKKIALGVSASAELEASPYLFMVSAAVKPGVSSRAVLAEIDRVIAESQTRLLSIAELERVKNKLEYSVINEAKSPQGFASWLANGEFYWKDPMRIFDIVEKYRVMTPKDVRDAARMYLKPSNRLIMTMKNGGHK